MEVVLLIMLGIILAFNVLIGTITNFLKQLQSSNPPKLKNGFEVNLSIGPTNNKKSEDVSHTLSSLNSNNTEE